jgi:PAS domain S-box-containing protein
MQTQWSCRFDQQDRISGYTCIGFDLEELNKGAAISYATCNRKILAFTQKFRDIVGRSIKELLTENIDQIYVDPGARDKLYSMIPSQGGAVGDWLTTVYRRSDGTTFSVEIRGGRYEHIIRFEIRAI